MTSTGEKSWDWLPLEKPRYRAVDRSLCNEAIPSPLRSIRRMECLWRGGGLERLEPRHHAARGGWRGEASLAPAVGRPRCSTIASTPPAFFTPANTRPPGLHTSTSGAPDRREVNSAGAGWSTVGLDQNTVQFFKDVFKSCFFLKLDTVIVALIWPQSCGPLTPRIVCLRLT